MIGFSVGFGCIPFLLLGEIFPAPQRSILSSIAGSFNLGVMFIVIKTYHYLEQVGLFRFCKMIQISINKKKHNKMINLNSQLITTAGTFWMYSIFCACGVAFVITVVPETKGRDLDSIANLFVKKKEQSTTSVTTMTGKNTINGKASPACDPSRIVLIPNDIGGKSSESDSDFEVTKF